MVTNKHVDHAKPEYQRDGEESSYMVKSTDTDGYSARSERKRHSVLSNQFYPGLLQYTAVVDFLGMILVKFSPFRINTKGPFVKFIN